MNRFQFVAEHQRRYGVKRLCQVIGSVADCVINVAGLVVGPDGKSVIMVGV
ncbi:hypothetical protein ACWEV3_12165 [Saccharopolyspora sp. NPDC003752]